MMSFTIDSYVHNALMLVYAACYFIIFFDDDHVRRGIFYTWLYE